MRPASAARDGTAARAPLGAHQYMLSEVSDIDLFELVYSEGYLTPKRMASFGGRVEANLNTYRGAWGRGGGKLSSKHSNKSNPHDTWVMAWLGLAGHGP